MKLIETDHSMNFEWAKKVLKEADCSFPIYKDFECTICNNILQAEYYLIDVPEMENINVILTTNHKDFIRVDFCKESNCRYSSIQKETYNGTQEIVEFQLQGNDVLITKGSQQNMPYPFFCNTIDEMKQLSKNAKFESERRKVDDNYHLFDESRISHEEENRMLKNTYSNWRNTRGWGSKHYQKVKK